MNILAIGAHPDDIEFGCGGTLIKYAERGHRVFLLIMTEGGEGGEALIRKEEQSRSQKVMGVEQIFWGGYPDTQLVINKALINNIEEVIARIEPVFIFAPSPEDTHQDHRHLSQATLSATRYVRNVLLYEGPTSQNFVPQVFVDISTTLEKKLEALNVHHSQVERTNIEDMSILELARSTGNFRGIQGRVRYAEAFSSVRLFINIDTKC